MREGILKGLYRLRETRPEGKRKRTRPAHRLRLDPARGRGRGGDPRQGVRRRRRRVERHQLHAAAARRPRDRSLEPTPSRPDAARRATSSSASSRPRWPGRRLDRLHEGLPGFDPAVDQGPLVHRPRHRRLRPLRHPRRAAPLLRGRSRATSWSRRSRRWRTRARCRRRRWPRRSASSASTPRRRSPRSPEWPAEEVRIPDLGNFDEVPVVDVLVKPGDTVEAEAPLISLESDKASMDVPAPAAGKVVEVKVAKGAKVKKGDVIAVLEVDGAGEDSGGAERQRAPAPPGARAQPAVTLPGERAQRPAPACSRREPARCSSPPRPRGRSRAPPAPPIDEPSFASAYASPAIRRLARELGANLGAVRGSGRGGRILREDVQAFVKQALAGARRVGRPAASRSPPMPAIDFSKFGEIEKQAAVADQEDHRDEPPPLLDHRPARHPARRGRHHRARGVPQGARRGDARSAASSSRRSPSSSRLRVGAARAPAVRLVARAGRRRDRRSRSTATSASPSTRRRAWWCRWCATSIRRACADSPRNSAELSQRARDRKLKPDDIQGGGVHRLEPRRHRRHLLHADRQRPRGRDPRRLAGSDDRRCGRTAPSSPA